MRGGVDAVEEGFADAARDIIRYLLRDMTHPEGGFYSAEDADSIIDPARPNVTRASGVTVQ